MTVIDGGLESFVGDRENIAQITGSKLIFLVWVQNKNAKVHILALALAYTIVKGTKWFLKVRRIKKFIANFAPYDLFKYMNKENNNSIKEK